MHETKQKISCDFPTRTFFEDIFLSIKYVFSQEQPASFSGLLRYLPLSPSVANGWGKGRYLHPPQKKQKNTVLIFFKNDKQWINFIWQNTAGWLTDWLTAIIFVRSIPTVRLAIAFPGDRYASTTWAALKFVCMTPIFWPRCWEYIVWIKCYSYFKMCSDS